MISLNIFWLCHRSDFSDFFFLLLLNPTCNKFYDFGMIHTHHICNFFKNGIFFQIFILSYPEIDLFDGIIILFESMHCFKNDPLPSFTNFFYVCKTSLEFVILIKYLKLACFYFLILLYIIFLGFDDKIIEKLSG